MRIINPLNGRKEKIQTVLYSLAAQENCDGEPYDQMQLAADYISKLEKELEHTIQEFRNYRLASL